MTQERRAKKHEANIIFSCVKTFPPCIMCVQYREGVQYRGGGIMMHVGDILSTVGDVQYRVGYHDNCGGYLEYRGGCSVPWGDTIPLEKLIKITPKPYILEI